MQRLVRVSTQIHGRQQQRQQQLAESRCLDAETKPSPPPDPFLDPGGYLGKARPFSQKESLQTRHALDATAPLVLSAEDHEHFLRTGFIHMRGAIPAASVSEAMATIEAAGDQPSAPPIDMKRVNAAIRELLGPTYELLTDENAGGYDMQRPQQIDPDQDVLAGSVSETVVTSGGAHCDDAYVTMMPQGWVLGSFTFLTPVPHRGGGFIIYPGSYLRYRDAVARHGPGCLKGAAPQYGGVLHEVLAEAGDVVRLVHYSPLQSHVHHLIHCLTP